MKTEEFKTESEEKEKVETAFEEARDKDGDPADKAGVPEEPATPDPVDTEGGKEASPPTLPLPAELPNDSVRIPDECGGNGTENGKAARRTAGTVSKVLSVVIGAVFCGISLLYFAAQAVENADKLLSKGVGELLLDEVYGAVSPAETDESTDGVPTETEMASPSDETEEKVDETQPGPPPDTGPANESCHPIAYESLANYSLLTEMSNETAYSPDLTGLLGKKTGVGKCSEIYEEYGKDAPVVLIIHTHATEAYTAEGRDTYSENDSFRTRDTDENVVAVGEVIAQILEADGINVIHCTELFDAESYRESYSRSYAAVSAYLNEYPSISYVFDVHRDSVFREDKTNVATYAEHGGDTCAQVMIVVGTDEGGADHPNWEDNLSFAVNVQQNMAKIEESVPRKINLRSAAFNQGLCSGSLLFEIGSCGNTLSEAKRAAVIAAVAISSAVRGEASALSVEKLISLYGDQK